MLAKQALKRSAAVAKSSLPSTSQRTLQQQSFAQPQFDDTLFQNLSEAHAPHVPRHGSASARPLASGVHPAPRRQSMTIREMSAFDDMFSRIFNAASAHPAPSPDLFFNKHGKGRLDPFAEESSGVGSTDRTMTGLVDSGDLFSQIRKHSRKLQWTSEADEELDRKKEEMSLCETDLQILEWAQREVFNESVRYEENARKQLAAGKSTATEPVQLQPLPYPHLIALLMRTFRDKYGDPHLALSVFDHARHLSVPSFVFGCTTSAYNELIETHWRCFRDLRRVCDALEEMQVNGVAMDSRTKSLCELVRKECGERELWREERDIGSGEVWEMVAAIDKVVAGVAQELAGSGRRRGSVMAAVSDMEKQKEEEKELGGWKKKAFADKEQKGGDSWEFGNWEGGRMPVAMEAIEHRELAHAYA